MSLALRRVKEGFVLKVKATPNAGVSALAGEHAGALKVKVAAQPEKGRANAELVEFLSEMLNIPKKEVNVIKGEASRDKEVLIKNLDESKIRRVLNG